MAAQCRFCRAPVTWVVMADTGSRNPLDVEPLNPDRIAELGVQGVVAHNPATGRGRALHADDLPVLSKWWDSGVSFHMTHWATCPDRARARQEHKELRGEPQPCAYVDHAADWIPHPVTGRVVCNVCHPIPAGVGGVAGSG